MSESATSAKAVAGPPQVVPAAPATPGYERPAFLDTLSDAWFFGGKSLAVVTGDTQDLFWCKELQKFLELERTLYQALTGTFTVLRMDSASGISPYDQKDMDDLVRACKKGDGLVTTDAEKVGDLEEKMSLTRQSPLPALQLLKDMLAAVNRIRTVDEQPKDGEVKVKKDKPKPVCVVVKFAGSIFPPGNFEQLSELDRQRLVTFLNLIEAPWFKDSHHLIILLGDTKGEINSRVTGLPSVEPIVIELPSAAERKMFAGHFNPIGSNCKPIQFEKDLDTTVIDTAGLPLTAINDVFKVCCLKGKPITRRAVLEKLETVVKAQLEGVAKIKITEHSVDDVIGYEELGELWRHTFLRCEKKETAVPVIIVSGPNGSGKTFQAEAYAKASGRLVLELTGLRSKWYGETDSVFEKLNLLLRSLGNILIIVDEADAKFGSVHSKDVHETERRLSGNLIILQGDPSMYGKVIWLLATSRPDNLDPDTLRRAPVKFAIFDLQGDKRKEFIRKMFARKNVTIPDDEMEKVLKITEAYSASDFGFLLREVLSRNISVLATLEIWQADVAIRAKRAAQEVLAALNCSYRSTVPAELREKLGTDEFDDMVRDAKLVLNS